MKNCSDDVLKYENDKVALSESERGAMRDRRNANRDRLKSGLKKMDRKGPHDNVVQGSYAMKTMVQDAENKYDIDDGAAFLPEQLLDEKGNAMEPLAAKKMVKSALLKDARLPSEPKILKNCVRIEYEGGFHVDIPVYRVETTWDGREKFQIAGESEWRKTNPRELTEWFDGQVSAKKRQADSDPQLRRMVRLLKKFARANSDNPPVGLVLTILADEAFSYARDREDETFRDLLQRVKTRIDGNWHVYNPKDFSEELTKPSDEARIKELSNKIKAALERLAKLDDPQCSRSTARTAWDFVFQTDYFADLERTDREKQSTASIVPDRPVRKEGGGTYA